MALNKRALGKSGLEITTVGFGSWAVGGGGWSFGWGPQDDEASIAAIRHAVSLGVNWIDTAAIYGLGHSEEVVGRAISGIPAGARPFIFTKCGLIADRAQALSKSPQRNLRPESIRRECEDSLRRLGVERIDLYQFHWPDDIGTPVEDSWGEMSRLAQEGKIRAAGVSNFNVALLERCERIRHVDSLQPPFSLIRRDAGRRADSLVRRTWHGRDRVQPDASGAAHGHVLRRGAWRNGRGRLAPENRGISGAESEPQSGPARRASADCRAARDLGRGDRRSVDAALARRDRRRSSARARRSKWTAGFAPARLASRRKTSRRSPAPWTIWERERGRAGPAACKPPAANDKGISGALCTQAPLRH